MLLKEGTAFQNVKMIPSNFNHGFSTYTLVDINPHIPDSPTSSVWSVCSITALATPIAFLILLRSATAPTSIVSLITENTQEINITTTGLLDTSSICLKLTCDVVDL